jgi:hypothetical protein
MFPFIGPHGCKVGGAGTDEVRYSHGDTIYVCSGDHKTVTRKKQGATRDIVYGYHLFNTKLYGV